jgi:uracil-DNA glycosylase family 4
MRVETIAPPGAKIMFVGEAPGEKEDITGKPFHPQAPAGRMFDKLLANARLSRYEVAVTNVAKERPPGNKIGMFFEDKKMYRPKPIMQQWVNELRQDIILYKPNIVVGLGDTALWALTGQHGITANRGYILECSLVPKQKILCTFHPQKINYEWHLGFTTIMDFRKAVRESESPLVRTDSRALNAFPSKREFIDYLGWLQHSHDGPIALDIETTMTGHLDILGLAANANMGISFTFVKGNKPVLRPSDEFEIWMLLAKLFKTKSLIMHNGLFDMASMWWYLGILATGYNKDTMVATHICWPETPRSLSYLSSICLTVPKWKHTSQSAPSIYNCEDAVNTYGCWDFMAREMDNGEYWDTFDFEMRQVWPASMLQLQGVKVDPEKQKQIVNDTKTERNYIEQELLQEIGHPINFNSAQQLQTFLYEELRLPTIYKRRKSRFDKQKRTADKEALTKLYRKTQNPILKKIMRYKKLAKLMSSFVNIQLSPENKVHTSYNITGATMSRTVKNKVVDDEENYQSFGRWSSSKSIILPYGSGNLQNIPYDARKMYVPPEGKIWIQADYKQAEAVVVSYEILDYPMIKLFQDSFGLTPEECTEKNLDIHKLTAAKNFRIPIAKVTKELRDIGKTIRHATNYSAGPAVVVAKIGCTIAQAKALLESYHTGTPQLRMWHKKIQDMLRQGRVLTNLLGRKHKFLKEWGDDLFRSAYSFIPQSTVGDLLNLALIRLYESYGDKTDISLQLHDAIYCWTTPELVNWTATVMKQSMLIPLTSTHGTEYYVDVDFQVGPTWGELKGFTPEFTSDFVLKEEVLNEK